MSNLKWKTCFGIVAMRSKRTVSRIAITLLVFVATGCASRTAPAGWLSNPEETQQQAYGAWVRVNYQHDRSNIDARGELIAVEHDTLFVLSPQIRIKHPGNGTRSIIRNGFSPLRAKSITYYPYDSLLAITRAELTRARVEAYDAHSGQLAGWTAMGFVSTLSHGVGLIISAPVWLLVGIISTSAQSYSPIECYPQSHWDDLRKYCRFPQGFPQGIDRSALWPKPLRTNKASQRKISPISLKFSPGTRSLATAV